MLIDKSHSKGDIITLFKNHGVYIDDGLTKGKIIENIENYMKDFKYNERIKNLTELRNYLKNVSPKQRPTTQQKSEIMFKSKKIIKWGKNDYLFNGHTYNNSEEVFEDVMYIYKWGDLPSVRRACKIYNRSVYCINHVNPIISAEVYDELQKNKIIKEQTIYNLQIRHTTKENPIIVCFD